ncbi:MAG TPA: hypothetical protein EYP59_01395 [Thiotrichaceae bacterium]|nr:hypothetical protein [Thiotrichaceae bacterium]
MKRKTLVKIVQEETKTIIANKNGQPVEILVQGIILNFGFPSGRWGKGNMVLLFEPKTGLFGQYISIGSPTSAEGAIEFLLRDIYIYLTHQKMVWFKLIGRSTLIRSQDFTERSPTLEQAKERFILSLENEIIEGGSLYHREGFVFAKDWYFFGLSEYLSLWFEYRRVRHYIERVEKIKLIHVVYEHSQWTLTLESSDKKQTFVHLDEHYNIVAMSGHGVLKNAENQNLAQLAQISIEVLEDSKEEQSLKAGQNCHNILPDESATIRGISIDYRFNKGHLEHGHLILLHHSKVLGWYFGSSEEFTKTASNNQERIDYFLANSYIFFSKERLVYFLISHSRKEICCQECFEKYRVMDHGFPDVLLFLKKQFLEVKPHNFFDWYRRIPLEKYLGPQFFVRSEKNGVRESNVKISKVTNQNGLWQLELESTSEKEAIVHKYTTFILDENYNVIEVLGDAAIKK